MKTACVVEVPWEHDLPEGHIYRAKPKEKWARLGHKELDRLSHAISETHKLASVEALPSRLISAFVKSFSQFSGDTADDENGFSRRRIKLSCILVDFGNHAWRYTDTPQQSMSCDLRASVYKAIQQYISATETGSTSLHTSENVHSASLHSQHPFDHCQVTLHIVRANITDPELLPKDIVQQLSKEITISIVNIPNIPSKVENYLFDFFSGQLSLKRLKITAEAPKQKENAYVMCRTFHNRTLKLPLHVDQYVRKSARLAPQFQPYADDLKEIYILEDVTESSVSDMVNLSGATLSSTEPVPKWEMADAPVLGPTTVTLLEIEGKIFLTETSKYNGILSEGQDGHTLKVNATDQTVSSRQDVATLTNEFRWAICFRDGCLAPIASLGSIDDNPEQAVCGYGIESGKVLTLLEKFQHIMTKSNIPNLNPAFETLNQLLAVLILAREGNEVPDLPMPSEGDSKPAMAARLLGGLVKVAAEYEHDSGMHAKLCQFITSYLTERKYNWDEDEAETSDGDNTGSINKAWRATLNNSRIDKEHQGTDARNVLAQWNKLSGQWRRILKERKYVADFLDKYPKPQLQTLSADDATTSQRPQVTHELTASYLPPEAKLEQILSAHDDLTRFVQDVSGIKELQFVLNGQGFADLDTTRQKLAPLVPVHSALNLESAQCSERVTKLLSRYNVLINTLSEIFISWNSVLDHVESAIVELEHK
ncbi:hypothetical protein BZG36_01569 [Bifiguratus adelaidae]|uniref:Uncharacterized protein n=1 Tax=Bifiguratus adelaidae TaxID=1938954 RepID=A0A261Y3W4_9FUNG|nr:hypothetical protein BZG36_01569 [Bifiguratus adelaidae]